MFKKIIVLLMIMMVSVPMLGKESSGLEKKLERTKYKNELDFKGIALSDALSTISKTSGISIVATSDVANLKIDLYLPKGQTLKKIIGTIKNTNRLISQDINGTLILSKSGGEDKGAFTGQVVGKVTEIDKISGITGVTITLGDDISTLVLSDVGGAFIITDVMPGTYILKAAAKGYKSNAEIIDVQPGKTTKFRLALTKIDRIGDVFSEGKPTNERWQVRNPNGDLRDTEMVNIIYADPADVKKVVQEIVPLENIVVDEKNNMLILIGIEDNIVTARNLVKRLDRPAKQIRIKAKIWEIVEDVDKSIGMDWELKNYNGDLVENSMKGVFTPGLGTSMMNFSSLAGDGTTPLNVSLNALKTNQDAEIKAEPQVVTLNGEMAEIKIVQEEIVGYEETETADGNSSNAPLFKEAGVILKVKPTIKSDQTILVEVYAKVSKFVVSGIYSEAGESKNEATTRIRVRDGESILIGGLKREDNTKTVVKVPILGDIPLLGALFTKTVTNNLKKELLIEITPEIVRFEDEEIFN